LVTLPAALREQRGAHAVGADARNCPLQRENGLKTPTKKTTRHSEKTRFSLGNAFFLQ
jgi:hypothetical protein